MKIAHLADLHLGLRRYHRENAAGANEREADVMAAFATAVTQILDARVDLVLIAGDVFDGIRPPNDCIIAAFRQFRRLQEAGLSVVMVGGNHDTPRTIEVGLILRLMAEFPNVRVVARQAAQVRVGDINVHCWPTGAALNETNRPEPDASAEWNIFLAHFEADQQPQPWAYSNWDYVALGDYHVAHEVQPGVWYSGSLEYVSTNPWGELKEERERGLPGKGWLLVELRPKEFPLVEFVQVPTRRHVDLPVIDAVELTADQLDLVIARQLADHPIADAVARQVVINCPKLTARSLNVEQIRQAKATALHFHLDTRRSVERRPLMAATRSYQPGRTLTEIVAEFLERRPMTPGVDREQLVAAGRRYMEEAERGPAGADK